MRITIFERSNGICLILRRLVDAGNGVQASWIADIGQALGNYFNEEFFAAAQIHVAFGVGDKLRLAALGKEEAEGDHFTLL